MPESLNYEMCDNILVSLRKIVHAMGIHSRQLHRTYALTAPQWVLLREVFRTKSISIGRLAQEVSLSNATVTGIIDRLEQLGYVSRARNGQDRRQVFLSCTDKGKKILQEMPPLFQEHFIAALSNLRDWEQGQMLAVVSRLAAMMGGNGSAGEDPAVAPALSEPDGFIDSCRMLLDNTVGDDGASTMSETQESLRVIRSDGDLPGGMDRPRLAAFLHEHLQPYEDTPEDIEAGLDYALNNLTGPGGFMVLALDGDTLQGALVMLNTGMTGYIPEHVLLFVAVHRELRGKGIGAELIRRAQRECACNIKLHVEYDNPARRLYERLGFSSKYAEMRWTRESSDHKS